VVSVNFLVGKTLGQYKVIEHIGHGGMAEVYKGQHLRLDRMVAVKVLHPFLAEDEGFVVRFEREARIVATLRNPNIVQVYDFDHDDELDIYYMVMEFIDGPSLKTRLSEAQLKPEEVAKVGIAIADALDYAHRQGMLHRDIKPANIMFTGDGQPVLADFGIAKMVDLSALTATGAMVGTPAYMAPEIGLGQGAGAPADIYSLGVVLYHMITGRLPFESDTPMGMVMQHINDDPKPPTELVDVSSELEAVILKAMAKQPETRYPNAREMADALRTVMGIPLPASRIMETPPVPSKDFSISPKVTTPTEPEEEAPPLVRQSWPEATADVEKTPMSAVVEEQPEKPPFMWRMLRALLNLVLIGALVAVGWWFYIDGETPEILQKYGAPARASDILPPFWEQFNLPFIDNIMPGPTKTPTPRGEDQSDPSATPTASSSAVENPQSKPTSTPIPTATSEPCTLNARLENVRVRPDDVVAPETSLVVNLTLRNIGECQWPNDLSLTLAAATPISVASEITLSEGLTTPVAPLAPDEQGQMVLPLNAPSVLGTYEFKWELQTSDGQPLGNVVQLQITVADITMPTPTPLTGEGEPRSTSEPLTLGNPTLVESDENAALGLWYGTARITATGGVGDYRYFKDQVTDATEIPEGIVEFEARRCEDYPLTIVVVSGPEDARWEGVIPYPWPERCE
jgi:serine/threonine protein kinase